MKKFNKVLLLGSGALKIGQAGEFDYSGSQALKALSEEGITTVLINPNIATVQTSEGVADSVYLLPVTPFFVEKVIEKEMPDGIMLTFGGQTALNCGVELDRSGILEKYGVSVLGTPVQAIVDTEDRDAFAHRMEEIGVSIIRSHAVESVEQARQAASEIGYPVILRSAYALGGLGSGFCNDKAELDIQAGKAFAYSPQVLVEKSLKGWKEVEYEVVRDRYDNCITVCNMENFDPLGIHTGESIVVAPCQTLNNYDINMLRDTAIRIVRHLGIIGECNVQYGYDPDSNDYRVIEVNARLSRSSALASKATGYPLAFIAAKLGLGYGLFELTNAVTKCTPAFFEPALDYVVCKIPRWDLRKFHGVSHKIGSSMKSVGEVMAIGRNFEEALQKGLRMIGQGAHGFVMNNAAKEEDIDAALSEPTDTRIFAIAQALEAGYSIERIHSLTKIDAWFLHKLRNIVDTGIELQKFDDCSHLPDRLLLQAKRQGFSDHQIAKALYKEGFDTEARQDEVRTWRKSRGIVPCVKQIDTLAAEFPAMTNYLYLTYNGSYDDIEYEKDGRSVIVLGSGAYRIGSSVEFDWCSVTALQTIRKAGWRGVMINYNPETVSTDYDICDRLYFEELTLERVLDICDLEAPHGTVVSVGGQIPNNLAVRLDRHRVPILGTAASDIDRAEDRHKFSSIVDSLDIDQPEWMELTSREDLDKFIGRVGFPVLIRPSYVLSGAAMHVCYDASEMDQYLSMAVEVSQQHPVVVSEFMQRCKEIEFDAVADRGKILAYAISEHVEFAGVHSGDATIVFPAQKIYLATMRRLKSTAGKIADALHITGPFNIQFLAKENFVKVIECNLRASRSFPFVSKVSKVNMIELATQAMLGEHPKPVHKDDFDFDYVGVKASQFSFARLLRADPVLGVDMASTGEAGCMGEDFNDALLKAMESVGYPVPTGAVLISSGDALQKADLLEACRQLVANGYKIYATAGSYRYLEDNGVAATRALWPDEEKDGAQSGCEAALDLIRSRAVKMVINIPKNYTATELGNGYKIRRAAVDFNVPLITNARLATAFVRAFCQMSDDDISIKASSEFKLNT